MKIVLKGGYRCQYVLAPKKPKRFPLVLNPDKHFVPQTFYEDRALELRDDIDDAVTNSDMSKMEKCFSSFFGLMEDELLHTHSIPVPDQRPYSGRGTPLVTVKIPLVTKYGGHWCKLGPEAKTLMCFFTCLYSV